MRDAVHVRVDHAACGRTRPKLASQRGVSASSVRARDFREQNASVQSARAQKVAAQMDPGAGSELGLLNPNCRNLYRVLGEQFELL